jgi:hypothetical protein
VHVTEIEPIVPDAKDWTWVLSRPCPECGLVAGELKRADIAPTLRRTAGEIAEAVRSPGARDRPMPTTWSPLEYGCHVRDVFALYDERLRLMLDEDDPLYANWDQDATAREQHYGAQDPVVVADEVTARVRPLADRFDALTDKQWLRPGRRSDGARFTVETFGRYLVHDPVHHLFDITGRRSWAG